jgi:hypothetical protein
MGTNIVAGRRVCGPAVGYVATTATVASTPVADDAGESKGRVEAGSNCGEGPGRQLHFGFRARFDSRNCYNLRATDRAAGRCPRCNTNLFRYSRPAFGDRLGGLQRGEWLPVPVVNQIRTYWWCNPPKIGRQRMYPAR